MKPVIAAGVVAVLIGGVIATPSPVGAASAPTITLTTLPAPPGDTGADVTGNQRAMTCPAPGTCLVIGTTYNPHAQGSIITLSGSTWSAVQAPLPGNDRIDSSGAHDLHAIACAGAGSCAIEGSYLATGGGSVDGREGLLLSLDNGVWTAVQAPVPADHLPSDDEAYLTSVACDAPGSCIAVGTYLRVLNSSGAWNELPLVETLSGGTWTPSALPLPADATGSDPASLTAVACGAPGSCTAVGGYYRSNPATNTGTQQWPLIETFTGGSVVATATTSALRRW